MAYSKGDGNATKKYILPINDGKEFRTIGGAGARCTKPGGAKGASTAGGMSTGYDDPSLDFFQHLYVVAMGTFLAIFSGPFLILTEGLIVGSYATQQLNEKMPGMTEPVFCDPHAGQF